jgi:NAD-dependent histone deacetylase SIR2
MCIDCSVDGDQDTCNQEHSKILRKRLRDVGPEIFVEETLSQQQFSIRKLLSAFRVFVPDYILDNRDSLLELLGFALYREMQLRQRLDQFSTVEDVVELLLTSKNIMVITGAGISTSLGIPDFRSKDTGFYSKLRKMGFEDPESVFNLEEFDNNPTGFYSLAGDLIPDLNKWSPTHQFIRILQDKDKLLRNYTQNIDNVESYAGINPEKIVHCHGSWKTASCRKCKNRVPGEELFPYLRRQEIARCKACEMSMSTSAPSLKRKRSHQGNANGKARKKGEFDDDDSDDGEYDIFEPGVMKVSTPPPKFRYEEKNTRN